MSHTPGSWQIGFDDGSGGLGDGAYIISQDGFVVVRGGNPEGDLQYGVIRDDDARLIAAAPDLLEIAKMAERVALMELGEDSCPDFGPRDFLEAARAAIAKAEGQAEKKAEVR